MNLDGHVDVCAFGSGQGRVWAGDGSGGWSEAASFSTPASGSYEAFRAGGDVDHNGYPDLVLVAEEGSWPNDQNHVRVFKESSSPAALAITPVDPGGGEKLVAGAVTFVDWTAAIPAGGPGTVNLELSLDGAGGPWAPIAVAAPNSDRYQWRIPPDTRSTTSAVIRYSLTVDSETVTATTPQPFTILGGDLVFGDGFESGDTSRWSSAVP
jgi:hypothetical protein